MNRTHFLVKYGELSIYEINIQRRYTIDDEDTKILKGRGYFLIGNPDNPDGASTDQEYFFIHDDLFDTVLETDQNSDITLKFIHKEVSFLSINYNNTY